MAKSLPHASRLLLRDLLGRHSAQKISSFGRHLYATASSSSSSLSSTSKSSDGQSNAKSYSVRVATRPAPETTADAGHDDRKSAADRAAAALTSSDDPAYARIDQSFENAREAYMSKTNAELLRCYVVFQLCSVNAFVEKNKQLMKIARRVLGKFLFEKAMKATFYGHFVAGEDAARIKPMVLRNMSFGVKSILDYSVEKDISREEARDAEIKSCGVPDEKLAIDDKLVSDRFRAHYEFGDRRELVTSARTYFYKDEEMCDDNVKHFIEGIDAVSTATKATGLAAVKLTALGRPQFLLQLSAVLTAVRRYFEMLSSGYGTGTIKEDDLERHLRSFNLDPDERRRWFTILDVSRDG